MKSITWRIVFCLLLILIFIILLMLSKNILKPVIISAVLSYMLYPILKKLKSIGLKEKVASLIIVLSIIVIFILTAIYIIPSVGKELLGIINNFDDIEIVVKKIMDFLNYESLPIYLRQTIDEGIVKINTAINTYVGNIFEGILEFVSQIPSYFLIPIFIYYFLADKNFFKRKIQFFIPLKFREKSLELSSHVNRIIQDYFVGQLLLSLFVFIVTFISLLFIKLDYPFVIAFLNGIANFIPYFGPIIGYIPALLLSLTQSFDKAIIVTVVFFLIQQVEANIISPKILSDCTGMHPVEVMIVLLFGGYFFGGIGMIFSVPVAATIKLTYRYIVRNMY